MSKMWTEVPPEKWDEIIEKFAKKIVNLDMVFPAKLFLRYSIPFAYIAGQLGRVFLTPFDFLDLPFEYISVFEKRENLEKLIKRSDELAEERERIKIEINKK